MHRSNIKQANDEDRCDCCKRFHRKLFFTSGFWLGRDCAEQYKLYLSRKDHNIIFHGYEKKLKQIIKMEKGL